MPGARVTQPPASRSDSLFEQLEVGETLPVAADPASLVIFGGAGDLALRKLLPALYNLHVDGLLPPRLAIVGVGRKTLSDEAYRELAKGGISRFSRRAAQKYDRTQDARLLFFHTCSRAQ